MAVFYYSPHPAENKSPPPSIETDDPYAHSPANLAWNYDTLPLPTAVPPTCQIIIFHQSYSGAARITGIGGTKFWTDPVSGINVIGILPFGPRTCVWWAYLRRGN